MSEGVRSEAVRIVRERALEPLQRWIADIRARSVGLRSVSGRLQSLAIRVWRQFDPRENRAVAVTTLIGVLLAIVGLVVTQRVYNDFAGEEFRQQSAYYTQVVDRAFQNYTGVVREAAKPFGNSPYRVDRWEFFEYAKPRLPRYPGLKALIWAPRIPVQQIDDYELSARNDGLYGFSFRQANRHGAEEPISWRPEYFPIYFIEPFEGNENILGYDLGADSRLRAAAGRAVETGAAVAAKPVTWLQIDGVTESFLVLQPVFQADAVPETAEARREKLAGFIVGIIDIAEIFHMAVADYTTPAWIDVYLYEAEQLDAHGRLVTVYASPLRDSEDQQALQSGPGNTRVEESRIDLAGQKLLLVIASVAGKYGSGSSIVPGAVMLIILLLTAVLVQHLISLRRHGRMMGQRMAERTKQLREARELNAALRKEVRRRMRVERQLRDAKNQAEVANRAKSDFLAMVSHELRTPLNAIIGFSEILTEEMFGPIGEKRYSGYAGDIRNSAHHLLSLINNILDLTRVESNHYSLDESNVDLSQVITDSVHLLEGKAASAGLAIGVDCDRTLPLVLGDELALRQIVINLLQNAVKFTPRGGRISVTAGRQATGDVVVEVADTGIGISAEDLKRVLEPFVQADTSLARRYEGAGLGLPLSKKLAEMHDGMLEIDSAPGTGTRVRLILPGSRAVSPIRAVG